MFPLRPYRAGQAGLVFPVLSWSGSWSTLVRRGTSSGLSLVSRCGFGLSCWGLRHSDKTWLCEKMAHRADWAKTKHSKLMMGARNRTG
ncbi:hypothetical protein ACVV4I_16780 [Escherichia coli]